MSSDEAKGQQVYRLFCEAIEIPASQRAHFLDRVCGEDNDLKRQIEILLASDDESTKFMKDRLALTANDSSTQMSGWSSPFLPGTLLNDRYRIIRPIGRGGMGQVFEAEQLETKRRVAIKALGMGQLSTQTFSRFRREIKVLARLQHPGIATIFDSGAVHSGSGQEQDTLPFYAMELVSGETLIEFAERLNLPLRERLEILAKVCEAVNHAHQHGVVHRDLKPSNILVAADGSPKILDFGIARLMPQTEWVTGEGTLQTETGQLLGTLPYMSPEQISGKPMEVDFRTDIYSLGVILYELLAGRHPYRLSGKSIPEAARIICDEEPLPLHLTGTTLSGLQADVETIVRKAIEKDRFRRYAAASDFAQDIRRFLADQPILARPASALYRFRKFARRNRAFVGGVAIAMLLMAAGTVISTWLYIRSENNLARARVAELSALQSQASARAEAAIANEVADLLVEVFRVATPGSTQGKSGADVSAQELVSSGTERVLERSDLSPPIRARLLFILGQVQLNLGMFESAKRPLQVALDLQRRDDPGHERMVEIKRLMAQIANNQGDLQAARDAYLELLAVHENVSDELSVKLNGELGQILVRLDQFEQGEEYILKAIELYDSLPSGEDPEGFVAWFRAMLGQLNLSRGDYKEAEDYYRQSLEMHRQVFPGDHPRIAIVLNSLGLTLSDSGQPSEANDFLEEAVAMSCRVWGEDNPNVGPALNNHAICLQRLGRLEEAEKQFRRLLAIDEREMPEDSPYLAETRASLAACLIVQRKFEEADQLLSIALPVLEKSFGPSGNVTLVARSALANLYSLRGDDQAEATYLAAISDAQSQFGHQHIRTLRLRRELAEHFLLNEQWDLAEPELTATLSLLESSSRDGDADSLATRFLLGRFHEARGEFEQAAKEYEIVYQGRLRLFGETNPQTIRTKEALQAVAK